MKKIKFLLVAFFINNLSFSQNENIFIDYKIVAVTFNLNAENYNCGISIKEKNSESNYYEFYLDNNSIEEKLPAPQSLLTLRNYLSLIHYFF